MAMLGRLDWYDIARTTNWTPAYVTTEELFPPEMAGNMGLPMETFETYDEPYKQTYSDYVKVQRSKDAAAYSVRAGLERSKMYENAEPGWLTVLKAHYGAIARAEFSAGTAEARMARFGMAPGMRNMATLGMMDEMRHAQLQLFFPHDYCKKDRQFDWAHKAMDTNEWAAIAARHMFDDMMVTHGAVGTALMLTFAFETGFTNMQFLGLASDAAEAGDWTFSNLVSSIQTDEARHAQIGAPLLQILVANGKKAEAQKMVDVAIWRSWKLFSVLTGPAMDYYTPLDHRKQSFKEFMHEWIVVQFERSLADLGLDTPWFWDHMLEEIDTQHHGMHLGVWFWRPTVWWNPAAGASPEERDWLEEKYPGWNEKWGKCWDVITNNLIEGKEAQTLPETLPVVCNMCQLPIITKPGSSWSVKHFPLDYKDRTYHFCSEPCKWCFEIEPTRYAGHLSIVDRFLAGQIQPPTLEGAVAYMGLSPGESGSDAQNYAWADGFRSMTEKKAS